MSTGASNGTPAIAVEALWQVFGPDAERQLKQLITALKARETLRAKDIEAILGKRPKQELELIAPGVRRLHQRGPRAGHGS